jgi:leucyl aminopeptidase
MKDMKMDMSGAGAVLAAMSVLRATRPRVRVVGYLCCTDNLPGGSAMKVSDVITYRNGTTVEVLNTDAEGRLVMADGLVLAAESDAAAIIDISTLTGACLVALGSKIAAVLGNNDGLVEQVLSAAKRTDEPMWQLPLPADYRKMLDSEVADLKNIGGPYGGTITAGLFLQEFVDGKPWVHLDIAGKERVDADEDWKVKGATGFGVRTFVELLDAFAVPT